MAKSKVTDVDPRKLYPGVQKDARGLLQRKFQAITERHKRADESVGKAAAAASAALRRVLGRDQEYTAAMKPLIAASSTDLIKLERAEGKLGQSLSRDFALGLLSGSGIRDLETSTVTVRLIMAKDTNLEVRVPPYNDAWTHADGGRHQQQQVWADKTNGRFGFLYTIGKEGGSLSCGAGVELLFMREHPGFPPGQGPAGLAQVRTFTSYEYIWRDKSYVGTAHQHAGFGVLVWSAPIDGGPSRTDLDHEYWIWSDGTSWYEDHSNPSFSGRDFDNALQFANQPPYFPIEPGRIYGAWIWCFADGDAHGADLTSAAYAQALIDATAKLIVIGQQ
jgi:hypothetical protein